VIRSKNISETVINGIIPGTVLKPASPENRPEKSTKTAQFPRNKFDGKSLINKDLHAFVTSNSHAIARFSSLLAQHKTSRKPFIHKDFRMIARNKFSMFHLFSSPQMHRKYLNLHMLTRVVIATNVKQALFWVVKL
jgi:hypothetical protein